MIPDSQQGLHFRRALFTVHLCRVDFLRVNCDCPASFAQKRAQPIPAVPRLGLSLDAAHLFGCRAVAVTVNLWMVRPVRSSLGLAVILGPFFYRWRKRGEDLHAAQTATSVSVP